MDNISITSSDTNTEEHWVSISDMMTGLMMIFLFISVLYMLEILQDKWKIEKIAVTYEKMQNELYLDLENEFEDDLEKWNAELNRQLLSIRFKEPDVLFLQGSSEVRPEFLRILDDFFPRYLNILTSIKYKDDIEEIRIEGHTSSEWEAGISETEAYIKNMTLSQSRTRSVLEYILNMQYVLQVDRNGWLKERLTANGLSSSKLILNENGVEDRQCSRRVEFRVRTNAEKRIVEIINRSELP